MASKGFVESYLNRLSDDVRLVLVRVFEYVLTTFAIGGPQHLEKAVNFAWYRVDSTTAAVVGQEFSIHHGIGQTPRWLIPILPLDSTGSQTPVLSVTRAADAQRVYLTSNSTSVAFTAFLEV